MVLNFLLYKLSHDKSVYFSIFQLNKCVITKAKKWNKTETQYILPLLKLKGIGITFFLI